MQMDRDRLATIFNLRTVNAVAAAECLNVTQLYASMSNVFSTDVNLTDAFLKVVMRSAQVRYGEA